MGNKKVYIASSRPIGDRLKAWAKDNMPKGWELAVSMEDCQVFISAMYSKLIPEEYINERKCFNFHPGILPYYRGSGAFSWALINNNTHVGITLHEIDGNIDHGDIIKIVMWPIVKGDTAEALYNKGMLIIEKMFQEWFEKLLTGEYQATKQDESKARLYFRKDLDTMKDLTRFVRAFTFEGKDSAYYYNSKGKKICIKT